MRSEKQKTAMTYIVHYCVNGRWLLGGHFKSRVRCDDFCEWLAADGIEWKID